MVTISFFRTRTEQKKPRPSTNRRVVVTGPVDYTAIRRLGCKGCPLLTADLVTPKMEPSGSNKPVVYILGEAPGEWEDNDGTQFVGRSGRLLRQALEDNFGSPYPFRFNNCCRCRPPKNRTPDVVERERCRNSVTADIERTKPQVLLAVGAVALHWALGESSIVRWRGKMVPVRVGDHTCWLYPILHPAFVLRSSADDGWETVFKHDLKKLSNMIGSDLGYPPLESLSELYTGVNYARDASGLAKLFRQLLLWGRNKDVVAFDIETDGLRPYRFETPLHGWLSIAFSDGKITWSVPISHRESNWSPDDKERLLTAVQSFLRSKAVKVAHNLPFELEWLTQIYGHDPPWRRTGWGDTMTQAYIIDERRDGLDLDFLILHRFGFQLKKQSVVDRAKLSQLQADKLLKYNALDAKYTARLYGVQHDELERDDLVPVYKFQLRRAFTLVKAQQVGLEVDFDKVSEFRDKLGNRINKLVKKISKSDEAELYRSKRGSALSPTSNTQLTSLFRDLLHRPEGVRENNRSGYSVDDAVLSRIDLPVAADILTMRRYGKLRSTYVDKFGPTGGVVYRDGRIHTKFNDVFTTTGRLSSDEPNMQNFPKRKDAWIRALVVPPKGHVLLSSDYGQIEYRVIAIASNDERIKQSLRDRYDVHMDWAERVAKADPKVYRAFGRDIKKLRSEIKNTWVFPAFYGAHIDYIAQMLHMNLRAARDLFEVFWEEFKGVHAWQRKMLKDYERLGYVECLTGRRRRAPLSTNMIYNSPIQGSASDVVVDAMCRLSKRAERDGEPALQPVLNIHDDLTFCIPKRRQDELLEIIVDEMLHPSFDWVTVPISVEVSVGPNWADQDKVDTFFSD